MKASIFIVIFILFFDLLVCIGKIVVPLTKFVGPRGAVWCSRFYGKKGSKG